MDLKQKHSSETSAKSSSASDPSNIFTTDQCFTHFKQQQKWEASSNVGYNSMIEQPFTEFHPPSEPPASHSYNPSNEIKQLEQLDPMETLHNNIFQDWDPRVVLNKLSFLEEKIHQLQDLVHSFVSQDGRFSGRLNEQAAQQQLVTADLTSIIIQLMSTAGTLLPSSKNLPLATNPFVGPLGNVFGSPDSLGANMGLQQNASMGMEGNNELDYDDQIKEINGDGQNYVDQSELPIFTVEEPEPVGDEENDTKDYDDAAEGENLPPGSYEVLQLEKDEILAPHTHFCSICGKGFKRDANLRMHMRGHGDEYKTPAALAKPCKELNGETMIVKRYSCPYVGCKRNKDHKKFQPLKTILCVKNHYKRSHCDKSYTCSKCNSKKFSVIADLKTHEKHCGRDKWLCSCGTTFSRKDKLFGHVGLFQGHTPVLPMDEIKVSGPSDHGQSDEAMARTVSKAFDFGSSSSGDSHTLSMKVDDDHGYFAAMNFNACNFNEIHDLP